MIFGFFIFFLGVVNAQPLHETAIQPVQTQTQQRPEVQNLCPIENPVLASIESNFVKTNQKTPVLTDPQREDFIKLFNDFSSPGITADQRLPILKAFQKNKEGVDVLFFAEKAKTQLDEPQTKSLALLLRMSAEFYESSAPQMAELAAKQLFFLQKNSKIDIQKQIDKLPVKLKTKKLPIEETPSGKGFGESRTVKKAEELISRLEGDDSYNAFVGLVELLKNKTPGELISWDQKGRPISLLETVRNAIFIEKNKKTLELRKSDGKRELEEALKNHKYDDLSRIGREYFYTTYGLKADMLHAYLLLKNNDGALASAYIQNGLNTIEMVMPLADPKTREDYERLQTQFKALSQCNDKAPKGMFAKAYINKILKKKTDELYEAQIRNPKYLSSIYKGDVESLTGLLALFDPKGKNFTGDLSLDSLDPNSEKYIRNAFFFVNDFEDTGDEAKIKKLGQSLLFLASKKDISYRQTIEGGLTKISKIGKKAEVAVPELVSLLEDSEYTTLALAALSGMGEKAASAIIPFINHQDLLKRTSAMQALGKMGPNARTAGPAVISFINSNINTKNDLTEYEVNIAIDTLGKMGGDAAKAFSPKLLSIYKDPDKYRFRFDALAALLRIDKKNAIPLLIEDLKSEGGKRHTSYRIAHIMKEETPEEVIEDLINLTKDHQIYSDAAMNALGKIGKKASKAIPAITKAIEKNNCDRKKAAEALGNIGAFPTLVKLLDRSDIGWRERNVMIEQFGKMGKEGIPQLVKIMNSERDDRLLSEDIETAGTTLGSIGKDAIPALSKILQDNKEQENTRLKAAIWGLTKIGREFPDEVLPVLEKALQENSKSQLFHGLLDYEVQNLRQLKRIRGGQ